MDILYAFAHVGNLVDNTRDVVAPVGELSSFSMTFSQDKLFYTNVDYPSLTLVSFFYQGDEKEHLQLDLAQQILILKATDWVYRQARFGNFDESIAEFQTKFLTEFGGELEIQESGVMVNFGHNQHCPESITIAPLGQLQERNWVIWLSDEAFINQCPTSVIKPVAPIVNLDGFFDTAQNVHPMVVPPDMQRMNDKAEELKGSYPYTALRTWVFDWVDPANEENRIPTHWLTVHYGESGNNIDQAKEAIRDHILENSDRGREEWAKIFPDIFTSTEFIVIPHYDLISRPSRTRQTAFYSPITNHTKSLQDAIAHVRGTGYNPEHIETVLETAPSLYRSLAVSVVGGPENRDGIDRFSERYPDFMNVATTHVDFGYMEEETRAFVLVLNHLLSVAESATPSSSIPREFNRITRDEQVYIATSFEEFLYLVVPKYAYGEE